MKTSSALEGGLAGAIALTLLHETVRKIVPAAPRMDLLGMQALSKVLKTVGAKVPAQKKLFGWTMASDLLANALFYSLAGVGGRKYLLLRGALLGLTAGAGAVAVPKYTSLDERYSSSTKKRSTLAVSWYLVGGLVAGAVMLALSHSNKKKVKLPENSDFGNPAEYRMNGFVE